MKNILLYILIVPLLSGGGDWELKKYAQGISIYSRTSEESSFRELRATVQVKSSLAAIVAVLDDWDSYPSWVYKCGISKTLKKISETEVIHYQTVVAPWPAEDRDFVVDVSLRQDPSTLQVKQIATCLHGYIPEVPDYVRIKVFHATWTLTPRPGGLIDVEYQLLVDPGGYVPAWLVNLAAVDGPFETTLHLVERLKMEKYSNATFPFITEKQ